MTNEQLVEKYQQGQESALDDLVKQNMGLVYHICQKFYIDKTPSIELQDLRQEGLIGLIESAKRYRADKGTKFSTFASYYIYGYISRIAVRGNTNIETSMDTKIGNDITLGDTFRSSTDHIGLSMLRLDLDNAMSEELNDIEENTIKLQYGWDSRELSIKEIAEETGKPTSRIRYIVRSATSKLRTNRLVTDEMDKQIKDKRLEGNVGHYKTNRLMKTRYK